MRIYAAAAYLLLASCGTPDRWHTSVSRGSGAFDGPYAHDYDTEETVLEIGVSGPLGFSPAPQGRCSGAVPPPVPYQPASPITQPAQPSDQSGLPWMELALLLGGAGAMKGGEYGYRKYRGSKAS